MHLVSEGKNQFFYATKYFLVWWEMKREEE